MLYVWVPLQSLPLIWVLLLPDSWQALFGLGVASWAVLLATMLLVMFMGRDPRRAAGWSAQPWG